MAVREDRVERFHASMIATAIGAPWYSFDLSIGYNTGEHPANDYLKNIAIQVIAQDILDKHTDYQYRTIVAGGQPCTCDILRSNCGRQLS